MAELEAKVGELNQSINDLTADKANLESRVTILVRVLHMRDDEIAQLQEKLMVRACRVSGLVGCFRGFQGFGVCPPELRCARCVCRRHRGLVGC